MITVLRAGEVAISSAARDLRDIAMQSWLSIHSVSMKIIAWHWASWIVLLGAIALAFALLTVAHRTWKKGWLSELIEERLSTNRRQRPRLPHAAPLGWKGYVGALRLALLESWDVVMSYSRQKLASDLREFRFPTFASFTVIALVIALFFLIPRPPHFGSPLHLRDLWDALASNIEEANGRMERLTTGVFTALSVVIIALVVFIAESIRDDNDYDRKRVLVRLSWIWPLGVAATLIPFGFFWSTTRGFTVLLESLVAVVTLIALARVIRTLVDPDVRAQARLDLLRGRIRRMIYDSARERVGNSILMEQVGPGKPIAALDYTISRSWVEGGAARYVFIDAIEDGWIADIHLGELKKLAEKLDRYAREVLGFGLREGGPATQVGGSANRPTPATEPLLVRKAYLLKRYREEIPADSIFYGKQRALLALPEGFERDQALLADIRSAIPHIFRFTKQEPSSVPIRREMQGTKDQLAAAIRTHALGAVSELRQTYLHVAEEFLRLLVDFGGGYTAEQARRERSSFLGESWTEIDWLQRDLRELIIIATDAGNIDVLGMIAFLPFTIAMRAIQVRDQFLFQQFFQFASFLYFLASDKGSATRIHQSLTDRSWRWPKEIADFYIERDLDAEDTSANDIRKLGDFALYSLRVFQDLLKAMADSRDVAAYEMVLSQFRKLYDTFREVRERRDVEILRLQLSAAQNETQRARIEARLEVQQAREAVAASISDSIDQITLALAGRILAQRLESSEDAQLGGLLAITTGALPAGLQRLAKTYSEAITFQVSDFWGWDQWDLVPGEAQFVDRHTRLNQIFALRALELLAALPAGMRSTEQLPLSDALAEMAREGNPQGLLVTLSRIEEQSERWNSVLTDAARQHIPTLREMLAATWTAEQLAAAQRTREAQLDPKRLTEFSKELAKAFLESGRLRHIFQATGVIELQLQHAAEASLQSLGINQIDDKNAFIEQDRTSYAGWGRAYGQGIAQGEDEAVFRAMMEGAGVRATADDRALLSAMEEVLGRMTLRDPIMFQSLQVDAEYSEIRQNAAFKPQYDSRVRSPWKDFDGFMGVLAVGGREVPVFDNLVRGSDAQNKVLIVDGRGFLRWRRFRPSETPDEFTDPESQLYIRVYDLAADASKRNEIIEQRPPWLSEISDKVEYLQARVLINVFEKFQIEVINPREGACISFVHRRILDNEGP